jgi:transcription elongation factor GreB
MAVEKNNPITPGGFQKLLDEYNVLAAERPKIVEEVSFAAKQGDRSENAEYLYGKRRLRQIDNRMHFLSTRIEAARVVNPVEQKSDCILFGATVTVEDENEKQFTYQIVGVDEVDVPKGKISWKSPLGAALIKKKTNDFLDVETPRGPATYRVVAFSFR